MINNLLNNNGCYQQAYEQQPAAVKDSNWRSEVKELRDKAEEYRYDWTVLSTTHVLVTFRPLKL